MARDHHGWDGKALKMAFLDASITKAQKTVMPTATAMRFWGVVSVSKSSKDIILQLACIGRENVVIKLTEWIALQIESTFDYTSR